MKGIRTGLSYEKTDKHLSLGISHIYTGTRLTTETLYRYVNILRIPTKVIIKLYTDSDELYFAPITIRQSLDLITHGSYDTPDLNYHLALTYKEVETLFLGELN